MRILKSLLFITSLALSVSAVGQEQETDNTWQGIGMEIPSLENDSDGAGAIGAYRALSSWTNLPKEDLEKRLLDYSVVRVRKPNSNETEFVEAKDIIDGKFKNYDAIMPQAYADTLVQESQKGSNESSGLLSSISPPSPRNDSNIDTSNEWSSNLIIHLGYITVGFACFVMIMSVLMYWQGMTANSILRISGLTLVVTSAVFLVIVGYSQEQIAPVIGLLGAVAGYLLGNNKASPEG